MGRDTDVRNKLTERGNHLRNGHDSIVHAVMSLGQSKSHSKLISMQERKYIKSFVKFFHLEFGTKSSLCAPNTSTVRATSTYDSFNFQERRQFGQYSDHAPNCKQSNRRSIPHMGKNPVSSPKDTDHPCGPPIRLFDGYLQRLSGVKRPKHEAHHSPPSSAEVKKRGSLTPLSQYAIMTCKETTVSLTSFKFHTN